MLSFIAFLFDRAVPYSWSEESGEWPDNSEEIARLIAEMFEVLVCGRAFLKMAYSTRLVEAWKSPVDWVQLLCVLGSEVERGEFQRVSDDIWHFDAECIEDHGSYVAVAGLGQDSLISFGDDQMRQSLSKLSGLEFKWG